MRTTIHPENNRRKIFLFFTANTFFTVFKTNLKVLKKRNHFKKKKKIALEGL